MYVVYLVLFNLVLEHQPIQERQLLGHFYSRSFILLILISYQSRNRYKPYLRNPISVALEFFFQNQSHISSEDEKSVHNNYVLLNLQDVMTSKVAIDCLFLVCVDRSHNFLTLALFLVIYVLTFPVLSYSASSYSLEYQHMIESLD